MSRIECSHLSLETCCGVIQIGYFNDGEDSAENAPALLEILKGVNKGYFYQVWFVRRKKWNGSLQEEYEENDLREHVKRIYNVVHLGTAINPNTGNEIDGYSWLNI